MTDLKQEQQKTLNRLRYNYSLFARVFFGGMDLIAGRKISLSKVKLLEILASIPYREWEVKEYFRATRYFRNSAKVAYASEIISWGRAAQDNEYMHLLIIHEKMKEEGIKDAWYLSSVFVFIAVYFYIFMSKILKTFSLRFAFYFNAQFEDHAEHVYAEMVTENPQWETQPMTNNLVKKYADVDNWADVFRQISLDEREHRNKSFVYCNKPEFVAN